MSILTDFHFWARCGNCGHLIVHEVLASLLSDFASHMRASHGTTNQHMPRAGITIEKD